MTEELWTEVCNTVQEVVTKTTPKKKKYKKENSMSEDALQIAEKRREEKSKRDKERYTQLNAEFQRIARKDKKAFLSAHGMWNHPRGHVWNVFVRPASS